VGRDFAARVSPLWRETCLAYWRLRRYDAVPRIATSRWIEVEVSGYLQQFFKGYRFAELQYRLLAQTPLDCWIEEPRAHDYRNPLKLRDSLDLLDHIGARETGHMLVRENQIGQNRLCQGKAALPIFG
jgi:hypothetical protein